MLYAGEAFKGPPPSACVIPQNGVTRVDRFPEVKAQLSLGEPGDSIANGAV